MGIIEEEINKVNQDVDLIKRIVEFNGLVVELNPYQAYNYSYKTDILYGYQVQEFIKNGFEIVRVRPLDQESVKVIVRRIRE